MSHSMLAPSPGVISADRISSPRMAKADLRKAEMGEAWRARVGAAVARTRQLSGLNLNQFADQIGRDVRQVSRWETGQERPQLDAIFSIEALRQPLVIALAELAGAGVEIETVVRVRRRVA